MSRRDVRPPRPEDDTARAFTNELSQEAKFRNAYGIEATLGASTSWQRVENEEVAAFPSPVRRSVTSRGHKVTAALAYDVVKGGAKGAGHLERQSAEAGLLRQKAQESGRLDDLRRGAFSSLVDLFAITCKIREIERLTAMVDETVKTGRLQARAGTLGQKDLLNILSLKISMDRRMVELAGGMEEIRSRLAGFGPKALEALAAHPVPSAACTIDFQAAAQAAGTSLAATPLDPKASPAYKAAEQSLAAAKAQLALSRLDAKASLKPFVSTEWNPEVDRAAETGSTTVGLTLSWVPQGEHGSHVLDQARLQAAAAVKALEDSLAAGQAQIQTLRGRIAAAGRTMAVLDRSLANSNELLATLNKLLLTDFVDSLSYTNAAINQVDIVQALYDNWATLEKSLAEAEPFRLRGS